MVTTIQLTEKTKLKLDKLKHVPRETYDEIVNRLIEVSEEDELEYSKETKEGLKRAYEDIQKGRVYSTKELLKNLGI